jgi:hypothetical protein
MDMELLPLDANGCPATQPQDYNAISAHSVTPLWEVAAR